MHVQRGRFVLSHGAAFFCPHTFDVKFLGTIDEDSARATLCETHFAALAKGVSSKMALRPNLEAGQLPALARGQLESWTSPVMYSKTAEAQSRPIMLRTHRF